MGKYQTRSKNAIVSSSSDEERNRNNNTQKTNAYVKFKKVKGVVKRKQQKTNKKLNQQLINANNASHENPKTLTNEAISSNRISRN